MNYNISPGICGHLCISLMYRVTLQRIWLAVDSGTQKHAEKIVLSHARL